MNYHQIISKIFQDHPISFYPGLKTELCPNSIQSYKSEGIKFVCDKFGGEIFVYYTSPIYCEIEYIIFKNGDSNSLICEFKDDSELKHFIQEFLNLRLKEIKQ